MSPLRRLFRLFSFGALFAALLLLWLDLRSPPPPVPTAILPAPPAPPAARPWPDLRDLVNVGILNQTQVEVLVVDEQQLPLAGITVSLADETATSDSNGRLLLPGVPQGTHRFRVSAPWLVREDVSSPPLVTGARQQFLLVLSQACPGPLRILDADGRPLAGVSLLSLSSESLTRTLTPPLDSDPEGWIEVADRLCGRSQIGLRLPGEAAPLWLGAEVPAAGAVVTLTIPPLQEAVLQVVDVLGRPLDAEVSGTAVLAQQPEGIGRIRLTSRQSVLMLTVWPGDQAERTVRIPVDGGEHVYIADPGRAVEVLLTCDTEGCPVALLCDLTPCEVVVGTLYACTCPQAEAPLLAQEGGQTDHTRIATVPWGARQVAVDLRREAAVRGRWTGPLPCRAAATASAIAGWSRAVPCDPDGQFLISELPPGAATLTVSHGERLGARDIVLVVGQELNVGDIGPADLEIDGWIVADFPLADARISVEPAAQVTMAADGWFQIRGLPEGTEQLSLHLDSAAHGHFEEWFWLGGSTSLEWSVEGVDGVDTLSPEEADAVLEDSGINIDDSGMIDDLVGEERDSGDSGL